jgi:SAM-dependent methyltransferase
LSDGDYTYHGSDDEITRWLGMFTSRNGDGSGDPEENFLSTVRLVAACKAGGSFLDIGSGFGRIVDIVKPYAGTLVGIEPDMERFRACRDGAARHANVEILNCFSGDLRASRPGARFDLITLSMVLQHVSTRTCSGILDDVRGMLKPGGVAVISSTHFFEERFTYEADASPHDVKEFDFYAENTGQQVMGIPVRLFSKEAFLQTIEGAGLEVVVWQQFFYARPERVDSVASDFRASMDDVRNVGFSQYCTVRRAAGRDAARRGPRSLWNLLRRR